MDDTDGLARSLGTALLDLVLPQACAGCAEPGTGLCPGCRALLRGPPLGRVAAGPPLVVAAASYAGPVRGLLLAHKERGRLALPRPLGEALAGAAALLRPPPGALLVPVPSSPAVVRARGHDHARRLAVAAAARLGLRAHPVLRQRRPVADAAGLGAAQRRRNVAGALAARRPLAGSVVVLVDDVTTTGATLHEAARAVAAAGGTVLGAAVVAATPARGTQVPNGRPALSIRRDGG